MNHQGWRQNNNMGNNFQPYFNQPPQPPQPPPLHHPMNNFPQFQNAPSPMNNFQQHRGGSPLMNNNFPQFQNAPSPINTRQYQNGSPPVFNQPQPPPYNSSQWSQPTLNDAGLWTCFEYSNGEKRIFYPNYGLWITEIDFNYLNAYPNDQNYITNIYNQQAWFLRPQPQPQLQHHHHQPPPPPPQQQQQHQQHQQINAEEWTQNEVMALSNVKDINGIDNTFRGKGWDGAYWQKLYQLDEQDEKYERVLNMLASYFTTRVVPSKMKITTEHVDPLQYSIVALKRPQSEDGSETGPVNEKYNVNMPQEVLNLESVATTIIVPPDERRRIFEYTEVRVGDISTLDLTKQLREKLPHERIAVLNMTHPQRPGGTWLKGGFSQEEYNFVQSCLSASLDEMDYPLDDFALRYSKDVPVIRESFFYNFDFIPERDRWKVDFVSMCGIDLSNKKGGAGARQFTSEIAVRLRAKIEAILSACVANGATYLVLGALGCGTFSNPPEDVASIFRAVLEQYAGFFQRVYFAIMGGNTPTIFANELVGPGAPVKIEDDISEIERSVSIYKRPPREWKMTTTDVTKPLCESCGICMDYTPEHRSAFEHPPECPAGDNCANKNPRHRYMFLHTMQNARAGLIKTSTTVSVVNPVVTKNVCKEGTTCKKFFDKEHMKEFSHPFLPPCPKIMGCTDTDSSHTNKFSHMCPKGNECDLINDPDHCKLFIHAGTMCRDKQCTSIDEEHLRAYLHPGVPFVREFCTDPWCNNRDIEHRRKYAHQPFITMGNCMVRMHNSRDPASTAYGDMSKSRDYIVDFIESTTHWLECLSKSKIGTVSKSDKNVQDVMGWMNTLRPVNMCSGVVLKSILQLGIVGSNARLQNLWKQRSEIVDIVFERDSVKGLYKWDHKLLKNAKKYFKGYVHEQQYIIGEKKVKEFAAKLNSLPTNPNPDSTGDKESDRIKNIIETYQTVKSLTQNKKISLAEKRIYLVSFFTHNGKDGESIVKKIEDESSKILEVIMSLVENAKSSFEDDKKVRTNHTVFTIVGPHMDSYCQREVVLIFRKAIMYHPDYYMLPNAATLYSMGKHHKAKYRYGPEMNRAAWMGENREFHAGGIDDLRLEKFHPIDSRWKEAAAKEFIYQTAQISRKPPSSVSLAEVINFWYRSNSHCVIEGHLPSAVPLDYIEQVFVQRPVYERLKSDPEIASKLCEWEARPGFLQIVKDANEVVQKSAVYFSKCPPTDVPKGFTFVISGADTKELFIPYKMSETAERVVIKYGALGGRFFVALSNIGDLFYTDVERKVITFGLNSDMSVMSAFYETPAICKSSIPYATSDDFSVGCNTKDFIDYIIIIDYKERTTTIMHGGQSAMYNNAFLTVPLGGAPRYSHISFSSPINEEPRPRIINLDFSYE